MTFIRKKIAVATAVATIVVASVLVPGTARAQAVISDLLTVSFDRVTQTRALFEVSGESVTADLAFTYIPFPARDFNAGQSADLS